MLSCAHIDDVLIGRLNKNKPLPVLVTAYTVGTVCTTGTSTSTAETVKLFSPAHLAATANLYFDYRLVLK